MREKITLQKGIAIIIVVVGLIIINMDNLSGSMQGALLGMILVIIAIFIGYMKPSTTK